MEVDDISKKMQKCHETLYSRELIIIPVKTPLKIVANHPHPNSRVAQCHMGLGNKRYVVTVHTFRGIKSVVNANPVNWEIHI